jgi:hypothetical protein
MYPWILSSNYSTFTGPPHREEQSGQRGGKSCQRGGKSCLRERKFPVSVGLEKFNHKLGNKKAKLVKMHMKELRKLIPGVAIFGLLTLIIIVL